MTPPVIAIVGPSGSGKTRVATDLIQRLVALGYRVAAVKHCPHGHQVDRPGTDSARLFGAGATKVVISSPGHLTAIERTEGDILLDTIVASLDPSYDDPSYDLVVVEGFKGSTVPKVLVLGGETALPLLQNVIAVVGGRGGIAYQVPCYSFQELGGLAGHIRCRVMKD